MTDTARCAIRACRGRLRFVPDAIGRLVPVCDACARRATRIQYLEACVAASPRATPLMPGCCRQCGGPLPDPKSLMTRRQFCLPCKRQRRIVAHTHWVERNRANAKARQWKARKRQAAKLVVTC